MRLLIIKGRNEEDKATRPPCDVLEFHRGCRLKLIESVAGEYEAACHFMLIGAIASGLLMLSLEA